MEEGRRPVAHTGGYLVVLLGAIGFVGSSFLPYYDPGPNIPGVHDLSFFRVFMVWRDSSLVSAGGYLTLFGGIATIMWICFASLRSHRSWTPDALLAVSVVWSFTWVGSFLSGWDLFAPHLIGYWALAVNVVLVLAGAIVVSRSARTATREPQTTSV